MKEIVFVISKGMEGRLNIKSKKHNLNDSYYNRYEIPENELYDELSKLADVYKNGFGIVVVFEVE